MLNWLFGKSRTSSNKNDLVRAQLVKLKDDLSAPRWVDHFAYFKSDEAKASYIDFVSARGYSVDEPADSLGVAFKKEMPVASPAFDEEVQALTEKAASLGGEYDGWGCPTAT